ncbi:Phage tail tape measure protein [Vibrio crassostreae]|uniref:phage tail tape measure protein n=1 Tax=Vibrio crassostreae TaxID=246167 RepID=UPI001BD3DC42|nr:phage tail tape measure protein [Vibrio crassostreae]CAK1952385.1 Phage tail tape measure protein [Vibrio crassostreae]CAK2023699.1 Phage tail tape measure protein [Vibrio crassostreae]CAK2303852.1 Phage tail tape measure protein [Vibrio crassostreae]CAK2587163.1 Phage tail tape measure protein [Vibrio crassostreae]CAK2677951.1 Phage tail tape measure protein [Vibrio crassostreae]
MSEKINLVLNTTVNGLEDIVSTTTATERLTAALESQRGEVISLNGKLKQLNGFESASKRAVKLAGQLDDAKAKVTRLSQELKDNKQRTSGLRVEYSKTQAEIKGLNSQLKKASGEGAIDLKNRLYEAQKRLDSFNDEIHQGKVKTNELNAAYKAAGKRVTQLTDSQNKQRDKLRGLGAALKESGINTGRMSDEQRKLEAQAEKATAAIAKQNRHLKEMKSIQSRIDTRDAKLSEIGGQATSLAMAAAPIAATVWSAVKNESSFADVKKVVDMTPEEADAMRNWSLRTSTETPMSANDINAMLAAGGQSGIKDKAELKQFVLDSAQMGVAFDMEAGQAGETLAVFKAALGLDQNGAMGLAGLANHLSNNSNAKASDIAGVMARQGASAKMAGFSANEAAALSASMLSAGMGEERSATALKNISGRLTLGGAATKAQQTALSTVGFDSVDLATSMQNDASGTLLQVLEAIRDAPLEEQSALITQIFGEEAKGAVASLAGNTDLFRKTLKLAKQGKDVHIQSLQDEYEARINTSENGISQFINKVNRLSVIVGTALLPALNWVLEPLGDGINLLADFAEANQGVTAAVGIGVAGLLAFKGAMLAGKAASLIFGNTLDKGRLFRKGLNRETQQSGRAAAFATKQLSRLNRAMMSMGSGRGGRGSGGGLGASGRRSKSRMPPRKLRSRNPLARAYNMASTMMTANRGALPLSLGGGALAMMPSVAMAQDGIALAGDVAQGAGKAGLGKLLRPLDMAISAGNIATAVTEGDTKTALAEGGGLLGSIGGASLGATIGTMVFPGVGTVIGGLAGSLLGDLGGEFLGGWFGDKLDSPDDKLMASETVSEKLVEKEKNESLIRQTPNVIFKTDVAIQAAPGMDEQKIAAQVTAQIDQQMKSQYDSLTGLTIDDSINVSAIDRG